MRNSTFCSIAATAVLVAFSSHILAQEATVVSRTLKGQRLNELAAWDLGSDKVFEIFSTSVSGMAACYSAGDLNPLWEKQISSDALTAPVIGNFMGSGAPILAFGSASGMVYFAWPGSGEVIGTFDTKLPFSLPPSIAQMTDGDKLILVGDEGNIVILDLHPESGLPQQRWLVSNTLSGSTAFSVIGKISQPASCADINNDGIPEVVVTSDSGVLQVISLTDPPQRYYTRLPQKSQPTTIAAIGDLSGLGQTSIALGVSASLQFFTWNPARPHEKAVEVFLSTPAFGVSTGHLLLGPVNADPVQDLVSTADRTVAARYLGNDFSGKQAFLDIAPQHLTTAASPFSPAVAITRIDGTKSVVSIDSSGVAWDWQPASTENTITRYPDIPVPTGFTPAGDLTGNGKLSLAVWNQQDVSLSVVTLPIDLAPSVAGSETPSASGPALTLGVNYSRNGQWGAEWATNFNARLLAASAMVDSHKTVAGTVEDSDLTTDPISIIAGLDPQNPVAVTFRKKHNNSGISTIASIALAAALLAIALLGFWKLRKSRR